MLTTLLSIAAALVAAYLIFRLGMAMLALLSTPAPEPPPAGELRRVRIRYRCSICGSEVRMTAAAEQDPEAPRHCMTEMDVVSKDE